MSSTTPPTFPPGYAEQDIGGPVVAVGILFIVLNIFIVTARFTVRHVYHTKFGLDDWLILPALLFALGMCVISIVEVYIAGVGQHLDVLEVYNPIAVVNWAKCGYAIEEIYAVAVAFPKLSILASYLRIFTKKSYRYIAYVCAFIISATAFAGVVTSLASCRPFSSRWTGDEFKTHCINAPDYWKGLSVPNLATDLVMLVLPMPVIWSLHVPRQQKLALLGVFLLGSLGMIAAIIRLVAAFRIGNLEDGTYVSASIAMWSTVEPGTYVIAACLPVMRPLFAGVGKKVKTTVRGSRHSGHQSKVSRLSGEKASLSPGSRTDSSESYHTNFAMDAWRNHHQYTASAEGGNSLHQFNKAQPAGVVQQPRDEDDYMV